ncbi:MAG TPA: Fur family transcriptional regulator [Acidimicrobiia bacterium]|jgi:Fur family ferric uptake transcriptional regulator|nr:Fur family transcriptional regulator [Acidimicrobiia bacterium]
MDVTVKGDNGNSVGPKARASRSAELHEAVRQRLAEHDIRYTRGRQALVTTLVRLDGPESAAELHERMSLPLSSIYRSLTVLDQAGVLVRHHDADGLARFELAEWLMGHHHHLVCVDCGTVEDVELDDEAEALIDRLAEQLAEKAGFDQTGHNLEVEGLCRDCRT